MGALEAVAVACVCIPWGAIIGLWIAGWRP